MKIYAFISTLSFFSILSSGLTQDEPPTGFAQDEPPRQQAPAEPTPGGKNILIKAYYIQSIQKYHEIRVTLMENCY